MGFAAIRDWAKNNGKRDWSINFYKFATWLDQIFTDSTITDFDTYILLNTDFRDYPTWALQVYFKGVVGWCDGAG